MTNIFASKDDVLEGFDLCNQTKDCTKIALSYIDFINLDIKKLNVTREIAQACRSLGFKIATALVEDKPFCLIWEVPYCDYKKDKNNLILVSVKKQKNYPYISKILGDSFFFQTICEKKIIRGKHPLPIIIGSCYGFSCQVGIFIDMCEYKKIGIE